MGFNDQSVQMYSLLPVSPNSLPDYSFCVLCVSFWKDKPDSIKFFVSLTATVIALKAGWLKELSLQLMEGNADQAHPLVITHFNLLVAMSNDALNHQHRWL